MAADLGVSYGMYCYASMQENSLENCDDNQGVSQDLEEVVKYYKMAVDAGHFGAMINYGLLFEIGKGVQKDVKEANEIVEISSEEF
ncbi:hypothetical protein TRFO_06043 [Tritrichomonas foetus]|uniref:Sel1 repeat family protein n=1 Tax=Tritrichomonas foetus TaxID=1144522 RepID=A0A1J4K0Z8_9EUKA|nr:hypothetical protein TRFO_06043 [Tritrichomonas foetus]|eukprot:OHT05055.1 hypothetical protein TRFO_06043 [Tritrichomonas foetus]